MVKPGDIRGPRRRSSIHRKETQPYEDSDEDNRKSLSRNGSDVEEHDECGRSLTPENWTKDGIYQNESAGIPNTNREANRNAFKKTCALIIPIILAYFGWHILAGFYLNEKRSCPFESFKKDYPKETEATWKKLQLGIENMLNKNTESAAVYLLINNGSQNGNLLMEKIAEQCSKCFDKKLIPMRAEDFISPQGHPDDYGHVIAKYKSKIEEGDVFLIANLNDIPPTAARALHFICDTYNPIKKYVVIFLTLNLKESKMGSPDSLAVEALTEMWGPHINTNDLDALITRVTDQVIVLKS